MKRGKKSETRGEKKNMRKRITLWPLATLFLANVSFADAQQTGKVPHIGYLDQSTTSGSAVSWRRSRRRCASSDGSRERISLSSIGLPSRSLSACLSWQRSWFDLRLI